MKGRCFLLAAMLCGAVIANSSAWAAQTQLTADELDYDIETGDFSARGRVTLTHEGLTMIGERGEANTQRQTAAIWGSVVTTGTYRGEPLDAKCDRVTADLTAPGGDYSMIGNVDAVYGSMALRSDNARLVGSRFSAEKVTLFEDRSRGLTLVGDRVDGTFDSQGILTANANGSVTTHMNDPQKRSSLDCDTLVYSRAQGTTTATGHGRLNVERLDGRGSGNTTINGDRFVHNWDAQTVTATGHISAISDGRRLASDTVVYHLDDGRVEARGQPRITVDLSRSRPSNNSRRRSPQR